MAEHGARNRMESDGAYRSGLMKDYGGHYKERRSRQLVTVCDGCLQASCWQGIFFCDDYLSAGTVDLPVETLEELAREHPDYWKPTTEEQP